MHILNRSAKYGIRLKEFSLDSAHRRGGWMTQADGELERFFKEYERYANLGEAEGTASLFAEVFLAADPAGVRAVSAAQLEAGVSQRKKRFVSLGRRLTRPIVRGTRNEG